MHREEHLTRGFFSREGPSAASCGSFPALVSLKLVGRRTLTMARLRTVTIFVEGHLFLRGFERSTRSGFFAGDSQPKSLCFAARIVGNCMVEIRKCGGEIVLHGLLSNHQTAGGAESLSSSRLYSSCKSPRLRSSATAVSTIRPPRMTATWCDMRSTTAIS